MSEPMIVIAIKRGYYGGKTRYEGERFAIASAEQFSKVWMVDPNGPKMSEEYKAMEQSYKAANTKPQSRGVSDEQLLAEITQSAGLAAGLRAENLKLKEKVSALQGQIDALLASGGSVRKDAAGADGDHDEGPAPEADEPAGNGAAEDAGDVGAGTAPVSRRVRRA